MNDFIEVWRPKIALAPSIKEAVKDFHISTYSRLRDDYGVEPVTLAGIESLYCDGICGWHDDEHVPSQYSLLYIVRNDTGSYVECKKAPPVKEQPVGTMVFLNIYEKHRLWHPKGMRSPLGTFLALCLDTNEKPSSKRKCEIMMRERIKNRISLAEAA